VPTTTTPQGPAGTWALAFNDEFDGASLDTSKWAPNWYREGGEMNDVGTFASNVQVANGELRLTLASSSSGALVHTDINGGYRLPVGSYLEARIAFPGSGTTIYNWPAFWASAAEEDGYPSSGEHDIAEGLGRMTVNYHSPSGAHNQGTVAGEWSNTFHTYGLYRGAGFADVYWDGVQVRHYPTDDSGRPEIVILNVGDGHTAQYGDGSTVRVDYVRAWRPA